MSWMIKELFQSTMKMQNNYLWQILVFIDPKAVENVATFYSAMKKRIKHSAIPKKVRTSESSLKNISR